MWEVLESDEFIDLRETLFSGQVFHFREAKSGLFVGNAYGDLAVLRQEGDKVYFLEHNTSIRNHLRMLFNLDVALPFPAKRRGLRFLTNEIVSTIFSFVCSSNNNVKRISRMVQHLYSRGDELIIESELPIPDAEEIWEVLRQNKVYSFPTLDKLVGIEDELRSEKFGYRARFVCNTASFLMENHIDWDSLSYEESRTALMRISGVGRKVADCICLVGLGFFHVVPLDTHLLRYSMQEFNLRYESISDKAYSEIQRLWVEKYGMFAGVMQLYVFKESIDARRPSDRLDTCGAL